MIDHILKNRLALRFNRYMVECELVIAVKISLNISVLIDTWWNVNVLNLTDVTNADKF